LPGITKEAFRHGYIVLNEDTTVLANIFVLFMGPKLLLIFFISVLAYRSPARNRRRV